MNLIHRFFKLPKQSTFIFGPRGVGKSTYLKENLDNSYLINLLDDNIYRTLSAKPERLVEIVHGNNDKDIFIIDEIQKIPELLNSVHLLIEEKQNKIFILTGSSSRKLKRNGVNLLAGRALLTHMHPFMMSELDGKVTLKEALNTGLIPLILDVKDKHHALNTYLSLYLKEEVQMEGLVREVGNFARFLEYVSFSHGSVLNMSNIAREAQTSRKIVENYISILEDLLLSFRIPVNRHLKLTHHGR